MRTTVELEEDTAAAIEELRREDRLGLSEAVNQLIRRGLRAPEDRAPFVQQSRPLGLKLDVSNIAEAIELLEGAETR